jgi:hypothetical protein
MVLVPNKVAVSLKGNGTGDRVTGTCECHKKGLPGPRVKRLDEPVDDESFLVWAVKWAGARLRLGDSMVISQEDRSS